MANEVKRSIQFTPRMKACEWCGKEFLQEHNRTKYCSNECRSAAWKVYKERADQKRTAQRGAKATERKLKCDNEAQIQMCLNCKKMTCNYGKCQDVLTLNRPYTYTAPEKVQERRRKVEELIRKGMTHLAISQELGCGVSTVAHDITVLRRMGVAV